MSDEEKPIPMSGAPDGPAGKFNAGSDALARAHMMAVPDDPLKKNAGGGGLAGVWNPPPAQTSPPPPPPPPPPQPPKKD